MSLATHAPRKRGDTRTRMLISAAEVMRERGAAGVTIDEVLTRSRANDPTAGDQNIVDVAHLPPPRP